MPSFSTRAAPSRSELKNFNDADLTAAALALASAFAARAGGIAADAWAVIPEAWLNSQRLMQVVCLRVRTTFSNAVAARRSTF